MIAADENALICDLAETYHIYDYRALPVRTLAVLSAGLRDDSRIKTKLAGFPAPLSVLLMAGIIDRLNILLWRDTKDGRRGINQPKPLFRTEDKQEQKPTAFASAEEYEAVKAKILANRRSHGN